MNLKSALILTAKSLLVWLVGFQAVAETFYVRGNSTPVRLEIMRHKVQNGTVKFSSDLVLDLPYSSVTLSRVRGELWDRDEQSGVYESFRLEVSAQDFFSQLYKGELPVSLQKRGRLTLTIADGHDLETRIPLNSSKRYLQFSARQGEYLGIGPLDFELATIQGEGEIGIGLEEPTLFLSAGLSGLGAFLSPVSEAGLGISTKKVFRFEPRTTFGIDKKTKKEMTFNGQLVVLGSAGIPKLPVSLTGEIITQFDGPLVERRRQGFNGDLEASYKFSGELGLSLYLGDASAVFTQPTLAGKRGPLEMVFSGVQDPHVPLLPKDFPLQPGNEIRMAGLMSSQVEKSFFMAHTDFSVLNIPLSQGRLRMDKRGLFASGFWKTPLSRISFSGEVSKDQVNLQGQAQAKLDVNGILEKVEKVTDAGICGVKKVASGAKCGYNFLSKKIRCSVAKFSHNRCMKNCRQGRVGGMPSRFSCELQCFAHVKPYCKKAKSCNVAKTCERTIRIPDTKLGHISADIGLLISNEGMGGEVSAEFCPIKKKCATIPASSVQLDLSDIKKPKVCVGKGTAGSTRRACVGI